MLKLETRITRHEINKAHVFILRLVDNNYFLQDYPCAVLGILLRSSKCKSRLWNRWNTFTTKFRNVHSSSKSVYLIRAGIYRARPGSCAHINRSTPPVLVNKRISLRNKRANMSSFTKYLKKKICTFKKKAANMRMSGRFGIHSLLSRRPQVHFVRIRQVYEEIRRVQRIFRSKCWKNRDLRHCRRFHRTRWQKGDFYSR